MTRFARYLLLTLAAPALMTLALVVMFVAVGMATHVGGPLPWDFIGGAALVTWLYGLAEFADECPRITRTHKGETGAVEAGLVLAVLSPLAGLVAFAVTYAVLAA